MKIKMVIDNYIREANVFPTAFVIAQKAGLSRQTVCKHFQEFDIHELYAQETKKHEFGANMLLERVFAMASRGDLKALKFYINTIERRKQAQQPNTQNNFIQINNIYVSEETLKALPEEERQVIEEIILSENLKVLKPLEAKKVDKS